MIHKLGEVIEEITRQSSPAGTLLKQIDRLKACESIIAGVAATPHRVLRVDNGILTVLVDNSMAAQELSFRRGELIKSLNSQNVDNKIRDIKFKISGEL